MELEVLFSIPKAPFRVVTLMTSGMPCGPNISLEGLYPIAAGQTLIAQTVLQAIVDRYHFGLSAALLNVSTAAPIRNRQI